MIIQGLKKKVYPFLYPLRRKRFQRQWRKKNRHNRTTVSDVFDVRNVSVGKATYGTLNITSYSVPGEGLSIGSFCSIAENVRFILAGEHSYKSFSTYPFYNYLEGINESVCKGKIIVGDDVWIGYGCTILSGVTIGQGAVIGTGGGSKQRYTSLCNSCRSSGKGY